MSKSMLKAMTKMRTEQEVLKDFEELGYDVILKDKYSMEIINNDIDFTIGISFIEKEYWKEDNSWNSIRLNMQEHKLLTELFTIWGWL